MTLSINKLLTAVLCGIAVSLFHCSAACDPSVCAADGQADCCAAAPQTIRIGTSSTELILSVEGGRLYQNWLGPKLCDEQDLPYVQRPGYRSRNGTYLKRSREVAACSGSEDYFEPAWGIVHPDGNRTTYFYFQKIERRPLLDAQGRRCGEQVDILLADKVYPVELTLHYLCWEKEDVFKVWSELRNGAQEPIVLNCFNSTMLYFDAAKYYLTQFSSDWAAEARMSTTELSYGKKVVDTKLGSRANLFREPFFEIGFDREPCEDAGTVLLGEISWPGNWRYTLEVDNSNVLCVLPGINPAASDYTLAPGQVFATPEFVFTLSYEGVGEGSRKLHRWARDYEIKDGHGARLSLLNNWENTYFNFDQKKLAQCMLEARNLGVDLFLLDDGWFGNGKDARNGDKAGLGDWEVNRKKLPNGIPGLCAEAQTAGVKFGIWIEPEMVNPQSKLFREHPDWVIMQPDREPYYYRNQLVLDLANPQVQDYVYGVVKGIMDENPSIAFFKWDCNSPITNIYSPYEGPLQGNMYIDHARGVLSVMRRCAESWPSVPMMLCSGGGGRCDYASLQYFTEFWCSDNTDPLERIYIQWGFSQFFPAKAMCAHVTSWNRATSVKFRTDVASMCKLGFDIGLADLSADELQYCREAVANWKRLAPAILDGDQYRLVSPYESNHMAVNYVSADKSSAVLFAYDLHPRYSEPLLRVKLRGLDPQARYLVKEINLMPGSRSGLAEDGLVLSGDYLMKVGLGAFTGAQCHSRVIELECVR